MKHVLFAFAFLALSLVSARWSSAPKIDLVAQAGATAQFGDFGRCYDTFNDCTAGFIMTDYGGCLTRNGASFFDNVDNECHRIH